jgi:hypothetical protein
MKTWYAHKMRICHVDKDKAKTPQPPGTARGGKIFFIQFIRKEIQFFYGLYKFNGGIYSFPPVPGKEKSGYPDPESDEIKIYGYPAVVERDKAVQRMIHPGHGNAPGKKRRPVLGHKKKPRHGTAAADKGVPEPFVQKRSANNFPGGRDI